MVIRDRNTKELSEKEEKTKKESYSNAEGDIISKDDTIDYSSIISDSIEEIEKQEKEDDSSEDEARDIFSSISKPLSDSAPTEPPLKIPKPAQENNLLNVHIDYTLRGVTKISRDDAERLGIKTGNIILVADTNLENSYKSRVVSDVRIEPGTLLCDGSLHVFSGVSNEKVIVKRLSSNLIKPEKIELTIKSSKHDVFSVVKELRKDMTEIRNLLSKYVLHEDLKIYWKAKDILLRVSGTHPKLKGGEVALLDLANTCLFTFRPEGLVPFNAILLMDSSKSMIGKDLEVKTIEPVIKQLKEVFGNVLLTDFLKEFKEGSFVKRKSGAAFAALLFLSEKVRRGLDETVSIVNFADDAEVLRVNGKPYVNSTIRTRELMKMAEQIIENVDEKYSAGTNMASAVKNCQKIIDSLPRNKRRNPTVIILLTDGFDTSNSIKDAVIENLSNQGDFVLNAVGIGPFVNKKELKEISRICGGDVFLPSDLNQLIEWYRKLARDLSIQLGEIDF